jgi:hypothetical protein
MLSLMSRLTDLSFIGVRFDPSEISEALMLPPIRTTITLTKCLYMTLQNLQELAIPAILRLTRARELDTLKIKDCPISDIWPDDIPEVSELILQDEDVHEDLGPILRATNPVYLIVTDCPSFISQAILEMCPSPGDNHWTCMRMNGLMINEIGTSNQISIAQDANSHPVMVISCFRDRR